MTLYMVLCISGYHHFHSRHGLAIKLTTTDHCRTAERESGRHHGLVFSATPLTHNEVFEVYANMHDMIDIDVILSREYVNSMPTAEISK